MGKPEVVTDIHKLQSEPHRIPQVALSLKTGCAPSCEMVLTTAERATVPVFHCKHASAFEKYTSGEERIGEADVPRCRRIDAPHAGNSSPAVSYTLLIGDDRRRRRQGRVRGRHIEGMHTSRIMLPTCS